MLKFRGLPLPAIKPVLEEVEECFLHHIGYLHRRGEDVSKAQEYSKLCFYCDMKSQPWSFL